jgi:DNA-binding SARP family transcriptional activator
MVLAVLAWEVNRLVTVERLIEWVWPVSPPRRADHAVRVAVSQLRGLLTAADAEAVIVTQGPGYLLRMSPERIDVHRFQALIRQARRTDEDSAKVAVLTEALALWRGPVLADIAPEPTRLRLGAGVEEARLAAIEDRTDVLLRMGRHHDIVDELITLVDDHPARERLVGQLMVALYRSGQASAALDVLRRTRQHLAQELGTDPDVGLQRLEVAILRKDRELDPPAVIQPVTDPADAFVGRTAELRLLHRAAASAGVGVALVSGEAGSGKSALLERFGADLRADGRLVCVGRCPESDGGTPGWAWSEALRELAVEHPPGPFAEVLASLLAEDLPPTLVSQARLHRALCGWLAGCDRPIVILVDDLHRAGLETLGILRAVAERLDGARLLVVAAYRPAEASAALVDTLGVLATRSPTRIALPGLDSADARRLVDTVSGQRQSDRTVAALVERTGGNPFYLKESARVLAGEGVESALRRVPDGVRDVLRHRFALLPEDITAILRLASVVGRSVEIDVLVHAAEQPERLVLDAVECGIAAGLLTEPTPGWVRFSHVLVRDTLYAEITAFRRVRWHVRTADAIAAVRPADVSLLAYHRVQGATAATAAAAAGHATAAGELAESRFGHDAAADWYREALRCLDLAPSATDDKRVDLLGRLTRALHAAGANAAAIDARDQALDIARRSGRDALLVRVISAWDHPTSWVVRPYTAPISHLVPLIERLLDQPDLDPAARCRLLTTIVRDATKYDINRAMWASDEALRMARKTDDPELLCVALSMVAETHAADRFPQLRIGVDAELMTVAARHGLVVYRAHAHMLAAQTATTRLDIGATRQHVRQARALAERHDLLPQMIYVHLAEGMLAHIAGRLDDAEHSYTQAGTLIDESGGVDADVYRLLGVSDLRISAGRPADALADLRHEHQRGTSRIEDRLAIALAAAGRMDQARAVRRDQRPIEENFLWTRRISHRAMAAVAVGERDEAAALYDILLPFRGGLAGGACAAWVLGPVAQVLGDVATLLGDPDTARIHYHEAKTVALRCDAPLWAARAAR